MTLILQATELAERCLVSEVLFWLALRRLPLPVGDLDGGDYRFNDEHGLRAGDFADEAVTRAECHFAGLPVDPRILADENGEYYSTVNFYDRVLASELALDLREDLSRQREKAAEHAKSIAEWDAQFEDYLAFFKAKIFCRP